MLAPRDRGLIGFHAFFADVTAGGRRIGLGRRPFVGQQQRLQLAVSLVDRQRLREVLEVAVQVHVFMRGAPDMRKTVGVERMDIQHRDALCLGLGTPLGVMQRKHLHTGAAITFHAVAGAADNQQRTGIGRPVAHHVHGQDLAVTSGFRMQLRLHGQAGGGCGLQELDTGFGITFGKRLSHAYHAASLANQPSASCTQKVAPSGIRSSLKS
ncbi:hypothetical protein D9M73_65630 [compost metagenome]